MSQQNIIIPDIAFNHSELQKLGASVYCEDYYQHQSNLVCSHAAGGLAGDDDWAYRNDAYLEILGQIPALPKLKVNLCSPEQSLFPLFSGQLNFITANTEGYWHLVLNVSNTRQLLPFLLRSNQVPQVIALIDANTRPGALLDNEQIMALLARQLNIDRQQPALELHSRYLNDHEGFQQMKNGKFALNIFSNHKKWDTKFLCELCDMADRQRLGRIYLTSGRLLLIKHIEENRTLVNIKEKIIHHLHAEGLSFQGLYIALDRVNLTAAHKLSSAVSSRQRRTAIRFFTKKISIIVTADFSVPRASLISKSCLIPYMRYVKCSLSRVQGAILCACWHSKQLSSTFAK